jgi:hypothetical protein
MHTFYKSKLTNFHIISSLNFIHLNYPFRPFYATGGLGLVGGLLTQEVKELK